MARAAAAIAKSIWGGGRAAGDLAAVNAHENGKKDELSIRPLGRPSHDFFALPCSTPAPSLTTLLPLLPLPLWGKTHGPLPGPQFRVHL